LIDSRRKWAIVFVLLSGTVCARTEKDGINAHARDGIGRTGFSGRKSQIWNADLPRTTQFGTALLYKIDGRRFLQQ